MLPNNALSSSPVISELLPPDNLKFNALIDYEIGGVALGDNSQGNQVKTWRLVYEGADVSLMDGGQVVQQITLPNVTRVALAFDQNMRSNFALETPDYVRLIWFDTRANAQVATDFTGITSPCLTLDDKRQMFSNSSDVIFAYLKNGSLCYRQQRDRYQTEYTLTSGLPANAVLERIGMGTNNRLQFVISHKLY